VKTEKNILEGWRNSPVDHSEAGSMLQLFLHNLPQFNDRIAISDKDDVWTYGDVFDSSVNLARILRAKGVCRDDLVVVVGDRCASFIIFLMGVLMVGGRFVVIDPSRLTPKSVDMLKQLRPRHWLNTRDDSASGKTPVELLLGVLDADRSVLPRSKNGLQRVLTHNSNALQVDMSLPEMLTADRRAYAIWTSGTTAAPKLVSTCHGSIANFLSWYIEEFELHREDRFSLLSGLAHDPIVRDIFAPLSVGGTLCIPSEAERLDPAGLLAWIDLYQVTAMHLTPSLMGVIAKANLRHAISSMRLLAFGGEQLTIRHVSLAKEVFPNAEIVNFYGATETPQAMGYYRVKQLSEQHRKTVPIGKGIRGVELMLLTPEQKSAAVGEEGEVYVRSRYLSEGYIGRPSDTSLRFVANPLTGDAADRVFRTGDFGYVDQLGAIHLTGRRDRQVKVNGHRVDLDDIEAELASHVAVVQAAVTFEEVSQLLLAYIVRVQGLEISEFELRDHIATNISVYSVPAKVIFVASIPITLNGKVDYRNLATLHQRRGEVQNSTTQPLVGECLKRIWETELSLPTLHVQDNFLDLGGDSIIANRIVARINETLDKSIRPADLFIYPTIESLENFLTKRDVPRNEHLEIKAQVGRRKVAIENARRRQKKVDGK